MFYTWFAVRFLGISTAIKTALQVALYDFFDGHPAPFTQGKNK